MGDHLIAKGQLLWVLVTATLAWPAAAVAQSPARGLHADRFDVALTLLADGSVDVRETVVFRFTEKAFTQIDREIPVRRFDGLIDVRASIDGRLLAEDDSSERVRIRRGRNTLRVTWTFPGTINRTRTFTLEYRAMGALAVANGRATMDWIVLPSSHRYVIDEARVEWRVPTEAVRLEPTTLDDPRWISSAMPDGWAATRHGVGVDESATLTDAFDVRTLAVSVPGWQTNAYLARQMAPAFLVGAVTLLVMGAGVVGMTWFRYRLPAQEPRTVDPAPADAWPPAIGTALLKGSVSIGLPQMQATLLDLARRGVLQISESPDNPKRFDVVMRESAPTRAHEEVVTSALWLLLKNGRVDLRTAWRHLTRTLSAFRRSVLTEMEDAGLVDAERRWAARGLRLSGIVVSLLGVAGVAIFRSAFGHLGDVPLLVPGAVVVSGILFVIAGQVMSLLTASGVAAAAEWRARRSWIKKTMKEPMGAADLAQWFPVAAGFGLAQPMLKASKDANGQALARIIAATPTASHHGGISVC